MSTNNKVFYIAAFYNYSIQKAILFVVVLMLFAACGQVGTITGGQKDTAAPQMVLNKVKPPNYSTLANPQKITIPFDEFIELNKPAENIKVTPNDVQLDYKVKGKSLLLEVKSGAWQPQTTYTIYLNRAVKDITERNDSIMSYVFSTGAYLDSLFTAIQVIDAYTDLPVVNTTVGLYTSKLSDSTTKQNPRYYASTDQKGVAVFQNLKDAEYFVYAFEDLNRNNNLDENEKRATLQSPVTLHTNDSIEVVSPIIRLMPPEDKRLKVVNNEIIPSATWCIGFNRPLQENEELRFIDSPFQYMWNAEKDSITAFYKTTAKSGSFSAILQTNEVEDTLIKKYFFKDQPKLSIKTNLKDKKLGVVDTLTITLNEPIHNIDTSKISIQGFFVGDTLPSAVPFSMIPKSMFDFALLFNKKDLEKLILHLHPHSVVGINYTLQDSLKIDFSLQDEQETGSLLIEFPNLPPYGILYIKNEKTKKEIKVLFDGVEKTKHRIDFLSPGQYSFYFLLDENRDGKWTTGSIFSNQEAEKIIWIPTRSTIRANWEVKTILSLEKEEQENPLKKGGSNKESKQSDD